MVQPPRLLLPGFLRALTQSGGRQKLAAPGVM